MSRVFLIAVCGLLANLAPVRAQLIEGTQEVEGIALVAVPAGSYDRGTGPWGVEQLRSMERWSDLYLAETPARRITIPAPFWMGRFEVTQEQWARVMREDDRERPSAFSGNSLPVENVSWLDIQDFLQRLNQRVVERGRFRLPTEAEWEYAARSGGRSVFGALVSRPILNDADLALGAWFLDNAERRTQPVGSREPNAWGLHDMLGNVWEWTEDTFDPDFYRRSELVDPVNLEDGPERVLRGGCWVLPADTIRPAFRGGATPDTRSPFFGFRLVWEPE